MIGILNEFRLSFHGRDTRTRDVLTPFLRKNCHWAFPVTTQVPSIFHRYLHDLFRLFGNCNALFITTIILTKAL